MLMTILLLAASPELDRCLNSGDAANGQNLAMSECYQAEQHRADGRLNRAYGAAMARSSSARKTVLRTSERAWIKHRDTVCERLTGPDKGTIQQLEYPSCMARETDKRTGWLRRWR